MAKQNNSGDIRQNTNFYPISSIVTSPGTHEYRLKVTSVNDNNCIDRYTNTVTIEVYEEFTAQITTLDQDICYNIFPDNQLEVLLQEQIIILPISGIVSFIVIQIFLK